MDCPGCRKNNDDDAVFCIECGCPLTDQARTEARSQRKPYWFTLLFLPVIAIAVAAGYYKFILPQGVAAEVNGEKIMISELNAAVDRVTRTSGQAGEAVRYQVLDDLITERLLLQESRKAGITVSKDEVAAAMAAARTASGLDEGAFGKVVAARFGSEGAYEENVARNLKINKLLRERIMPRGADPRTARLAVDRWLQGLTRTASVRISLAEQGNTCARSGGCAVADSSCSGCGGPGVPARGEQAKAAIAAGLKYWQARHGAGPVTASARDFGCHVQVDIVQNNKIIGSLRYQNGSISE
jgi:hypothetical protein